MDNFQSLKLDPILMTSLERMEYTTPTPIQAQAIPLALQGRDIMGSAQTGTGKTAAFAIPLIQKLLESPEGSALVLTPTRELGKQIMDIMHQLLGPKSGINTAFIIGGEPMGKQFSQLRRRPRLIVGTPGRINDHLERGTLNLEDTGFLVLDETDRMLDMGFSVQLDRIAKYLPKVRQTLMFSATLPNNIMNLSAQYLHNPERISVGDNNAPVQNIKQDVVHVTDGGKYTELTTELSNREGSVIIFVKTKHGTERLAKRLKGDGFKSDAIHGDLKQNRRSRVIKSFRQQEFRILVATDVVARGLDIPHIEHVINYDLPQVPEDYIHRIGRTGRAGAEGSALCLISPQDRSKWMAIEQLIDPDKQPSHSARPNSRGKARRDERTSGAFGRKKAFGARKPFKSGKPRRDASSFSDRKPRRDNESRGDSREDAQGGNKSYRNDKPRSEERSYGGDKPRSEGRSYNDKKPYRGDNESRGDSRSDSRGANKSYRSDKPRSEGKSFGDKPYRSDRPRRDNESRGDSRSDSRGGNKSYRSDKPRSEGKSFGDKPYRSDRPRSDN
ncbi:MAG: DEAD/DEAH box helicase, partial [Alphaproteobacteria bacterium]|nr:DEAD/DEAH box helicase [Alphaproteobacteria bacterium]